MRRRHANFSIFEAVIFGLLAAFSFPSHARPQQAPADGSSLQGLYNAALNFQKTGDLNQAAEQYRQFLAAALDELANGRSWAGENAKASELFEQALTLTPTSPTLQLDYARAALRAGDLKHAETLTKGVLNQDSIDPRYRRRPTRFWGSRCAGCSATRMPGRELEAAVALDPNFTNQYELAAVCLSIDEEKCAVQAFDWIQASTPGHAGAPYDDRTGLRAFGFYIAGRQEFKKVIAEDPRYPEAHYCVAAALLAVGEDEKTLEEAESELKEELTISPNDFLTYAALGKIALSYHRYPEAEGI